MTHPTVRTCIRLVSLTVISLLFTVFSSRADSWRTVTSGWSLGELAATGDTVWAAASGGLLRTITSTGEMKLFNQDTGLTDLDVTNLAWDSLNGRLWIGFADGGINIFDPLKSRVVTAISDFSENKDVTELHDLELRNGVAWVLTNIGLSRLDPVPDLPDRWVVRQTYRQLGTWSSTVQLSEVAVWHRQVFVGSDAGVIRGSLDDDLRNPDAWHAYDWQTDLGITPDQAQRASLLEVVGDTLFLSAAQAVWTFDGQQFVRFGNLWGINGAAFHGSDSIAVARWNGINLLDLQGGNSVVVNAPKVFNTLDVVSIGQTLYGATTAGNDGPGGLLVRDPDGWELVQPDTPGGDNIGAIGVDANGDVWVTALRANLAGVFRLHGNQWISYTNYNTPTANFVPYFSLPSIGFDDAGGTWVGSIGSGLHLIAPLPEGGDTLVHFDRSSSPLDGVTSDPTDQYVSVIDFARDPNGGMWVSNAGAYDRSSLIYVPPEWVRENPRTRNPFDWIKFGVAEGLTDTRVGALAVDDRGRVWIGYPREDDSGSSQYSLMMYDPSGTPEDPSDDQFYRFIWSGLPYVIDLAIDEEGILWMGTPVGLYSLDITQPVNLLEPQKVVGAVSEYILAVTVDPLDQVWVATDFGVSVLGRDRYTWIRNYTTVQGPYPSPIVTDQVVALAFNSKTGDAWLGTNHGVSVVTTPFRDFSNQLVEVKVAPQPFVVDDGSGTRLDFSSGSLTAGATVRIYTPSGRLVRTLGFETAALNGWDGKNENGDWVASGVYLIVITGSGGDSRTGKVAVIRK